MGGFTAGPRRSPPARCVNYYAEEATAWSPLDLGAGLPLGGRPIPNTAPGTEGRGARVEMTLKQACLPEYWGAHCAFNDSMIH